VTLRRDETLWTESSHKYNTAEVARLGDDAGFGLESQWVDTEWPFAQSLLVAR
jgi:uncharacterized SAM-dependent methyltransferase